MIQPELTPAQEAEAARIEVQITLKMQEEAKLMARYLASQSDADILGKTEFKIRDHVHHIGAYAIETALNERKKGGTKVRA